MSTENQAELSTSPGLSLKKAKVVDQKDLEIQALKAQQEATDKKLAEMMKLLGALNVPVDPSISPAALHEMKIKEEEKKRKAENVTVDQWIRIITDHQHKFGSKVRICKKMKNGNVYSHYLGRYKKVHDLVKQYQDQGLRIER
jgi:hypothetical protein